MTLPPVVRRIKQKGIPDEEIRVFVGRQVGKLEGPFTELTSRAVWSLQDCAVELVALPAEDPYWNDAPRSENFAAALQHFLETRLRGTPAEDRYVWARIGQYAFGSMSPGLGEQYWTPLVVKDPATFAGWWRRGSLSGSPRVEM